MRTPCARPNSVRSISPPELVKEFTELQGIGAAGLYARVQGESEPVWQAIYDHYKPESMGGTLSRAIAPRRLWRWPINLTPSAAASVWDSSPPDRATRFALRRAAQGVVRILVEGRFHLPLFDFLAATRPLKAFLAERACATTSKDIRGFAYDEINACMARSGGWSNLGRIWKRDWRRVRGMRASPIEPLAAAFKRIANILDQAGFTFTPFNPALLEAGPEKELYEEFVRQCGTAHRDCDLETATQDRLVFR